MSAELTAEIEVGDSGPEVVYRFYAPSGALLYVGVTGDPQRRFGYHARKAGWWQEGLRRTVTLYATRDDALDAETEAILAEGPLFNLNLSRGGRPRPKRAPRTARRPAPWHPQMGTTIRCLREKDGFTRSQLADTAGIEETVLADIEREAVDASADILDRIAHALVVDVAAITRAARHEVAA